MTRTEIRLPGITDDQTKYLENIIRQEIAKRIQA